MDNPSDALVAVEGQPGSDPDARYPRFQEYFRTSRRRLLAVWGRSDPFFLPAGAESFKRDIPDADVRFLDTGHFALETHVEEIATAIREFPTA
ncbi:alpha/beta fold hydrolase [Streptomyces sp. NPDC056672]|uniref:alpha/beta fold hydrolase n=1 Tax=Streptomyces sp. NPDC056672 TaxID=3345906 RepID=UPI003683907B